MTVFAIILVVLSAGIIAFLIVVTIGSYRNIQNLEKRIKEYRKQNEQ